MSTDSAAPLLHTKLTPPPLRRTLLRRDRLCALLDQGLAEPHRLTLISAPAGAGKTTLVTAWLQALPGPARVAWLAVDARDNDPARFLGYLVAALQRVDPALGQRAQSLLGTPQLPPLPTIVAELINDLAALSAPILLVLDDYHAITSAPVHAALDHLIDYQPAALHLVIATREDPPLPLARLRARGQLTELRAQELGFTSEEARDFFQQALGLDLDAATVAGLAERTEGWAAGLHLAGLALQRQPDPQAFVATFTGTHRYIIEYLLDEVLRGLTPELRAFLGHTAVLARFNAELCQVVTGNPAAAAILAELERANLFVTALDDRHGWYRYHQLFAEALRATLAPAAERAVQVAAARWFAAQGLLAEAIPLWLELGDVPAASRLIPTLAVDLLRSGELHTLLGWLDALPGPVVQTHPDLAAYKAFCLMMLGQLAQARLCLSEAEQAWGAHPSPQSHGRLLAMQALLVVSGGAQGAGELAQAALRELDADDGFFRAFSLMALGYARAWGGSLAEASQVFHEAYRLGQQLQHPFIALGALSNLAATLLDQGRLREAEAHCRAALAAYVDRRGQPLPIVAVVAIRLAAICYERGALDEARGLVTQGMDWCRRIFPTDVLGGDSEVILARIAFQQGNPRRAVALLQEAAQAAGQHQRRTMRYKLVLVQAELQLLQGNLAATVQGLQELETLAPSGLPKADQLVPHLQARYLLATGQPEQALAILERLEETARAAGSTRHLIHIALSQALAHQQCGALEPARQAFAAALRLAIPEGYRTLFVPQPGLSTRPLLQATRSLAPAFVDAILAAAPLEAERAVQLEEPLSDQERRVLTLLVAGKSNQEIAAALLIGVGTAKWHVHNILQKLGARNRAEAIARARALGLPTA